MSSVVFARTARVDIEPPHSFPLGEIVGYCVEYRLSGAYEWQQVYIEANADYFNGEWLYGITTCYLDNLEVGAYEVCVHAYYYDQVWGEYVWGFFGEVEEFTVSENSFFYASVSVVCGPLIPLEEVMDEFIHPIPYPNSYRTSVLSREFYALKEE